MKTIKYFLALLIVATIVSCSTDDDSPTMDDSLIVGEWNLEDYTYSGSTSLSQAGFTITTSFLGELIERDVRVNFNSDNTYRTQGSYIFKLTTTYDGETFVENHPFNNIDITGTYTVENNKIITGTNTEYQQPGQVEMAVAEGNIVELTSNRLVIGIEENITLEEDGIQMNITMNGRQIYSR